MIFVGIFGLFHGIAHGIEVPAAAKPILFVLGFIFGLVAFVRVEKLTKSLKEKNILPDNYQEE